MRFSERNGSPTTAVFAARYPGNHCGACQEPVEVGQDVTYEGADLVHADCLGTRAPVRETTVCRTCFVTRPCFCEA